jgi:hypothetical protein
MVSADVYLATELLVVDKNWAVMGPLSVPLCESGRMWDAVWTTQASRDPKMMEDERVADGSENCMKVVIQLKQALET